MKERGRRKIVTRIWDIQVVQHNFAPSPFVSGVFRKDRSMTKKMSPARKKEAGLAYLFLLPLFIGIVLFFIVPIFQSVTYSFTKWKGVGEAEFVGLKNYINLFTTDAKFKNEFVNTLVYVIGSVPLTMMIALLIANLLNMNIRAVGFYRVIYFIPNVMMGAVIAMVWKWVLNSRFGVLNAIFGFLFGIQPAWLSDTKLTMISMCVISIWSGLGYCIVIILSGLQGISQSYYEAAKIDGANAVQRFTLITVPLITPSLFFLLITRIIGAFNQFDIVYMIAGDPGPVQESLRTMVFGIYNSGFKEFSMGYASAKAVVLFAVILVITLIQFLGEKKWVHY